LRLVKTSERRHPLHCEKPTVSPEVREKLHESEIFHKRFFKIFLVEMRWIHSWR